MIYRIGDRQGEGRAVSVNQDVDIKRIAVAVRQGSDRSADPNIVVDGVEPGRLHEYVGCIHQDMSLRPRTALAVAGRSIGWSTSSDDEMAAVQERLANWSTVEVPTDEGTRKAVAERVETVEQLRERVAAERGRAAAGDADADIAAAVRELSEAETALAAARERKRHVQNQAATARDRLQERLRLEDQLSNLQRAARRELVERARTDYRRALRAVPGLETVSDPFEAPPDAMALAVGRVGDLSAPAVIDTGRFADPTTAADWLGSPVIQL